MAICISILWIYYKYRALTNCINSNWIDFSLLGSIEIIMWYDEINGIILVSTSTPFQTRGNSSFYYFIRIASSKCLSFNREIKCNKKTWNDILVIYKCCFVLLTIVILRQVIFMYLERLRGM